MPETGSGGRGDGVRRGMVGRERRENILHFKIINSMQIQRI